MNLRTTWRFKRIDLTGAAIAVLATGLFYWAAVCPVLVSWDRARSQQSRLDETKHDATHMAAQLEAIKKRLAATRQALDATGIRLESVTAVNSRISSLTALAARNGLRVDEVHPAEPTYGRDHGSLPISISASGGFAAWAGFLRELSRSFPDTSVDSFVLSSRSDGVANSIQIHVNLTWFVSAKPQSVAHVRPD